MHRLHLLEIVLGLSCALWLSSAFAAEPPSTTAALRIGIIGLDTSHCPEFVKILNDPKAAGDARRAAASSPPRIRAAAADISSSINRVGKFTADVKAQGVEVVNSIDALLLKVDAVLLESVDGRPHLKQALPVLKAKKPCFIDKPFAGSLADAVAIFAAAEKYDCPVFTSSSLRYFDGADKLRSGEQGEVLGCDTYGPCSLEPTHPDLYWYGIHGIESLFTVMGTGCESVTRVSTKDTDFAVGTWKGGRIGSFRGLRKGKEGYGGTAFTSKEIVALGKYGGYRPLVAQIVKFFHTGKSPVSAAESLEIYTFMEAADESKRQDGKPVRLADVLAKAQAEAAHKTVD